MQDAEGRDMTEVFQGLLFDNVPEFTTGMEIYNEVAKAGENYSNDPPMEFGDSGIAGYCKKIFKSEANNNLKAHNKYGSAYGPYQFINSTWKGLTREMGVNWGLEDRADMQKATRVMEYFTRKNEKVLRRYGIPINDTTRYAAHFLGPEGAVKLWRAPSTAPMTTVLSVDGCKANPGLAWKHGAPTTVGFVRQWLNNRMKG